MASTIHLDIKEDDPNIKYHKQYILTDQERYDLCGFRTLTDLKNYGKLRGKDYTGDSFEDAYKIIFGKDLDRHVALRKYRKKVRERMLKVSNFDKKIVNNAVNRILEYIKYYNSKHIQTKILD